MAGALSPERGGREGRTRAPPVDDAFAVLRLGTPGRRARRRLHHSELRTLDSCIAKRRGKVHVGGGATWGAAAAFSLRCLMKPCRRKIL